MTHISLGAAVEDLGPLFFWVPFRQAEGIAISAPQDLAVMRATATVAVTCDGLFVPEAQVVGDDRGGYWRAQHGGALTNPVAFLLGIGAACLDGLRAATARSEHPAQRQHVAVLAATLAEHRTLTYGLLARLFNGERDEALLDALLAGRVAISKLVLRLAEIAIAAEGGRAHLRSNPAQRHLREASFFLTSTINASAREALVLEL
jgi:alkylation response protein AidB-like acyl-CoA dehydrogenase